jgi:integrase
MGKLNDKTISAARAQDKDYKLSDGDGLFLLVKANGSKLWRMKYRVGSKEKLLSFGQYPLVTLKEARDRTFEARKLLAGGIDPSDAKKAAKTVRESEVTETVEQIAREWFDKFSTQWAPGHASKIIRRLERDLFPHLGKNEIKGVMPVGLLAVLRRVEARGAVETAHRLMNNCGQVWRYAVATGRAERDITGDLKGALAPVKGVHLGAITDPCEIGALLRNIEEYKGSDVVRLALQIAPLVFVRPGELRQAKWCEIDIDKREWTIPAEKMKGRRPHVVPLSTHAMTIIEDLKKISGDSEYLFPTPQSKTRCLSDAALLSALRRMGYSKEEMTAHGFRAMASTNLEQLGYDVRIIELQLAHADGNEVRAAYKRDTSRLQIEQRAKMMQGWANYLDGLRSGMQVVPFKKVA